MWENNNLRSSAKMAFQNLIEKKKEKKGHTWIRFLSSASSSCRLRSSSSFLSSSSKSCLSGTYENCNSLLNNKVAQVNRSTQFWRRWITWPFHEIYWQSISIKTSILKSGASAYVSAVLAWLHDIFIGQVAADWPKKMLRCHATTQETKTDTSDFSLLFWTKFRGHLFFAD